MRLSAIKIAGFKSFVDPATLPLSSAPTAIVGPNGCGKSNVIDAIRWVLGESNARALRGEALDDVIFNGARSRKPVGRATIELVFDNSDGALGGEYAKFGEISVKRELVRSGSSHYFLNGSRCRRRDITDLFMGTGLGSRSSYAVIAQGTVSRLIEARPEDMRLIIEEAAGISKYKERRRETESRLRHTRENLERVEDLKSELDERSARLQSQAEDAENYKRYKAEERELRAQLLALRYRELDEQARARAQKLEQAQQALDEARESVRAANAEGERLRREQDQAAAATQNLQAEYYNQEAEVSRAEQALVHAREMQQMREKERVDVAQQLAEHATRAERKEDEAQALDQEVKALGNRLHERNSALEQALEETRAAEHAWEEAQQNWEMASRQSQEPRSRAKSEEVRAQGLESGMKNLRKRVQRLEQEQERLQNRQSELDLEQAESEGVELEQRIAELDEQLCGLREEHARLRDERGSVEGDLHEIRQAIQSTQGRLSSLEALIQSASGQEDVALGVWLKAQGLPDASRLSQVLTVSAGWEQAVETALGSYLHSLCAEDIPARLAHAAKWPDATVVLLDKKTGTTPPAGPAAPSGVAPLSEYVQGPDAVLLRLNGVFAAENMERALAVVAALDAHQLVVTKDGCCLGPGSVYRPNVAGADQGILEREKEVESLRGALEKQQTRQGVLEQRHGQIVEALTASEAKRGELEPKLEQSRKRHNDLIATRRAEEARQAQYQEQAARITTDLDEIRAQLTRDEQALESAHAQAEAAREQAEYLENKAETVRVTLARARDQVRERRGESEQLRESRQKLELELTNRRASAESAHREVGQLRGRLSELEEQRRRLEQSAEEEVGPSQEQEQARDAARVKRDRARQDLESGREAHVTLQKQLHEHLEQAREREVRRDQLHDDLQQVRIHDETQAVHRQNLAEQMGEAGYEPAELLQRLDGAAEIAVWEKKIARLEKRIEKLGPINLAAIQEYEKERERSEYLYEQYTDLNQAVATLEQAIQRIDKETRSRFRATFDQVNSGFQALFPKLFGGGEAYLEVTGDDLLDTGIRTMARPPGKRNSSIQLLSGGEKTMTAVALVFALFELNPAPFCILDEVDAPLDDANVVRFCDMVKSMSDRVQFILITHNKVTMELAHRLHGVTMQEPGVSRLVSVDLEEASAMVG